MLFKRFPLKSEWQKYYYYNNQKQKINELLLISQVQEIMSISCSLVHLNKKMSYGLEQDWNRFWNC